MQELRASAQLLSSTLEASQDGAIIIDPQGRISEWSLVASRLLGITRAQAIGQHLEAVLRPEGTSIRPESNTSRPLSFVAHRDDGSGFPAEGHIAPLPNGRFAVFLRDVSDRKRMEARLMMSDRLETMGTMVAGVAHEINNPLAYVLANLNFLNSGLRNDASNPELQSVVQETIEGARRIHSIVQDLRILSRSGEQERPIPVVLEPLIDSVISIAQHHLKDASVTVVKAYAHPGPVLGVESRLAQVFLNLVVNAAQALDENTQRRELLISTRHENNCVVVGIRDFGPGVGPELREKLFTPFFTTKPAGSGTGLGLYISQSIIAGLNGELRMSHPEVGALFEVVLPLHVESGDFQR